MSKKKLILCFALIIVLSIILSGCGLIEEFTDFFCCGALAPLPVAALLMKLLAS